MPLAELGNFESAQPSLKIYFILVLRDTRNVAVVVVVSFSGPFNIFIKKELF